MGATQTQCSASFYTQWIGDSVWVPNPIRATLGGASRDSGCILAVECCEAESLLNLGNSSVLVVEDCSEDRRTRTACAKGWPGVSLLHRLDQGRRILGRHGRGSSRVPMRHRILDGGVSWTRLALPAAEHTKQSHKQNDNVDVQRCGTVDGVVVGLGQRLGTRPIVANVTGKEQHHDPVEESGHGAGEH